MKAKEMAFDFLETVFLLACILFFIFYLFFGGHLDLARKIFQTAGIISFFGIFVIIRWKFIKEQVMKRKRESTEDEAVTYLEGKDILRDKIFLFFVASVTLLIAAIPGYLNSFDVVQALTLVILMGSFHMILFSKRESGFTFLVLTAMDEVKDRVFLMFLSMFLLIETMFVGGANFVDIFQISFVFISYYYWHKHIFKC